MIDLGVLIILFCITVLSTSFTIFVFRPFLKNCFKNKFRRCIYKQIMDEKNA